MIEFESIYFENDYDQMCVKLTNRNLTHELGIKFPNTNPRILLSAYMIKNFAHSIGTIEDELLEASIVLCNKVSIFHEKDIQKDYTNFSKLFKTWREKDLLLMSEDVQNMTIHLRNTIIENPMEDYDIQWNSGVEQSIKHMDNTLQDIEILSKSPPK